MYTHDKDAYPSILDSIVNMKILLKINVNSSNINDTDNVYNVLKISNDEQLLARFGSQSSSYDVAIIVS